VVTVDTPVLGARDTDRRRSADLAERCRGARTPGLQLPLAPQPLTAREREVAVLAARGWTATRIAEALVVSHRTVENHLHRAYAKLGVSSRRELAEALQPGGGGTP
ncbi:helix-turn-helix transcriptional regulator, partial [Kineococcus glutinatus]|uniref:helix-turn-helix domain-containing protein n=1 Tax=Kineococcus glutinatus TaxID=1070872 RepID=UPI0031E8D1D3